MANAKDYSVEEKLSTLVNLQKIESKMDEIQILKGELPMEVSDLEDEIQGLHAREHRIEEEVNGITEFINQKKELIKEAEALIKKYEKQAENVKNNREFEAVNKEIEMQTLEIRLAEKHIKDANEEISDKARVLDSAKKKIEEKDTNLKHKKGELEKIIDDVLDYEGDATQIGKNLGDDLREGKNTLPLIIAMQRCAPSDRDLIRNAIETGDASHMPRIVELVRSCGAMQATREAAAGQARDALQVLSALPETPYKSALQALASQLTHRQH